MGYKATKKWRMKHPELRRLDRANYYNSHPGKVFPLKRFTRDELLLVVTKMKDGKQFLDVDICAMTGRSMRSLHVLRAKVKNGYGPLYARQWLSDGTKT